jgi:hypothetical protein
MNVFNVPEEIHEILRLAARFGKNWSWVEEYLYCFRSAPDKPLRATRVKILLEEILEFLKNGGFSYDGKDYVVRSDAIYAAIKHVAQTNKTGFKNHNYMKKVAIDFNQKIIAQEEREQKLREEEAAHRIHRDDRSPGFRLGESSSSERRIREIIKGLR